MKKLRVVYFQVAGVAIALLALFVAVGADGGVGP